MHFEHDISIELSAKQKNKLEMEINPFASLLLCIRQHLTRVSILFDICWRSLASHIAAGVDEIDAFGIQIDLITSASQTIERPDICERLCVSRLARYSLQFV